MGPRLRVHPVTGPPGAGKTTALLSLARGDRRLARFGVRDYGLELAEAGHPLGLRMRDMLRHGRLVSDDLVRQEFAHFLAHLPAGVEAVTVEGYPRDLRQCSDLDDVVAHAAARLAELIVVDIPDDVVRTRVAGRRICGGCGLPVTEGADAPCSACGGPAVHRHDDETARLDRRLLEFRDLSAGVREYFRTRGLLRVVDGLGDPEKVRQSLLSLLFPEPSRSQSSAPRSAATTAAGPAGEEA